MGENSVGWKKGSEKGKEEWSEAFKVIYHMTGLEKVWNFSTSDLAPLSSGKFKIPKTHI